MDAPDQPHDGNTIMQPRSGPSSVSICGVAVLVLVVLALVGVSQFIAHLDDGVLDDHLFAYYGWRLAKGATLYLDVWDRKPPGVYWMNHLGMALGGSNGGMVILCALAQVIAIGLLYRVCRSMHGRSAAAVVALLGATYLTNGAFFGGSNRAETFLVPCELGLVAIYLRAWQRGGWSCWAFAGACAGAALLMKQTGGAALAAAAAHLAWCALHRDIDSSAAARRFGLMLAGVGLVVGIAFGVLAAQGALGEAVTAFIVANSTYLAIESVPPFTGAWWWVRLERSSLWLLKLPILLAAGSAWQCLLERRHGGPSIAPDQTPPAQRAPRPMSFCAFWLIASAMGALAGPTASGHYMLPVFPPLLLMGGRLISGLCRTSEASFTTGRRAWLAAAVAFAAYLAWDPLYFQAQKATVVSWQRDVGFEEGHLHIASTAAQIVGRRIAAVTKPDERILSWDYLPGVTLAARRPPASRFPSLLLFACAAQAGAAGNHEFEDAVRARESRVLILSAASWQLVRGRVAVGKSPRRGRSRGIEQWILNHYEHRPELSGENIVVLVRRPAAQSPG